MCCRGERHHMKLRDKSIEEERENERKLERETSQDNSPKEIIYHFSHPHPLIYIEADYESFSCNSCARSGRGNRYHCGQCNFDLHKICAETPLTWLVHHMPPKELETFGVRWEVMTTFAHLDHDVVTEYKRQSYRCDHCNNSGDGLRFSCDPCDIRLHQVCATNPTRLTTYMHPDHELELSLRPYFKYCDLCGTTGSTNNRMYRCKKCDFYLHTGCNQWPLHLAHPLHPPHPLVLMPCDKDGVTCSDCKGLAQGYKYSCQLCGLNFDLGCIMNQSKFGVGEDVRRNYDGQDLSVLPVTNVILPANSQVIARFPVQSGYGGGGGGGGGGGMVMGSSGS